MLLVGIKLIRFSSGAQCARRRGLLLFLEVSVLIPDFGFLILR